MTWKQAPVPGVEFRESEGGYIVRDVALGHEYVCENREELQRLFGRLSSDPGYYPLGDALSTLLHALGAVECDECLKRRAALNRLVRRRG